MVSQSKMTYDVVRGARREIPPHTRELSISRLFKRYTGGYYESSRRERREALHEAGSRRKLVRGHFVPMYSRKPGEGKLTLYRYGTMPRNDDFVTVVIKPEFNNFSVIPLMPSVKNLVVESYTNAEIRRVVTGEGYGYNGWYELDETIQPEDIGDLLAKFPNLESLELDCTRFFISEISGLTNLESLRLHGVLRENKLSIYNLPSLRNLELGTWGNGNLSMYDLSSVESLTIGRGFNKQMDFTQLPNLRKFTALYTLRKVGDMSHLEKLSLVNLGKHVCKITLPPYMVKMDFTVFCEFPHNQTWKRV
jgi:hypothetical protein